MSERGSFVTEYIGCPRCWAAARQVLLVDHEHYKFFRAFESPPVDGKPLPIIAGKIGGLYFGEELVEFESYWAPELAKVICHPLRVAVLADHGQQIFNVAPAAPGVKP